MRLRRVGAMTLALLSGAAFVTCSTFGGDAAAPSSENADGSDGGPGAVDAAEVLDGFRGDSCSACLGGSCIDGSCQPVVIAAGEPEVSAIALDETSVYWVTTVPDGGVRSCPRAGCGGAPPSTVIGGRAQPRGLAVVEPDLFWTERGASGIQRCNRSNCVATRNPMATTLDGGDDLATDGTSVFALQGGGSQTLTRCAIGSGMCNFATNINGSPPNRITAYGGYAFYSPTNIGGIRKWNMNNGAPLGYGQVGARGLALTPDGGTIVFLGVGGVVASLPNRFTQNDASVLANTANPQSIALDETRAYFTDFGADGTGSVFTCELVSCSKTLTVLASGARPFAIVIDDVSVYYSVLGNDAGAPAAVMRVAKP